MSLRRLTKAIDLVPVASEFERRNKMTWGFSPEQLQSTGLPRWDPLLRLSRELPPKRSILYAPTWRSWDVPGAGSATRKSIRGLLENPRLLSLLEESDSELVVYMHQYSRYLGASSGLGTPHNPRISFLTTDAEFPLALATASLFISDYSGIVWDALYIDKPIMFYHFDLPVFESRLGAYVNLREPLVGPAVYEETAVLQTIEQFMADGWTFPAFDDHRKAWEDKVFEFRDDKNCERVALAIDRLLAQHD